MHTAYAFQWVKILDSKAFHPTKEVSSISAGHMSGRGFSTDGPYASAFDFTLGKANKGWYWDFSLMGGFGVQPSPKLTLGVVAGLRGSGITQGELATAWGVPVEVHATYAVAPRLSVLGYVRPIWHFGETPRVDDATIGSFADEFELGANVAWAQVTKPGVSKFGLLAGVVYHELRDTAYVGIRVGAGYANRP